MPPASSPPTLVGDGIENPWNARVMQAAAAMFASRCRFRERAGLAEAWKAALPEAEELDLLTSADLAGSYAPLIALDNVPGAQPVYGFRPPRGPQPALVAGNERRGIARDVLALASHRVTIPMAGDGSIRSTWPPRRPWHSTISPAAAADPPR